MSVRCTVFPIFDFKKCCALEIRVRGHSRSLKVVPIDRLGTCFLLVFYRNFVPKRYSTSKMPQKWSPWLTYSAKLQSNGHPPSHLRQQRPHLALCHVSKVSILNFMGAKDDEDGGDNWSYKTCKAPVKSSPQKQTNTQIFTFQMPFLSPNQQRQSTEGCVGLSWMKGRKVKNSENS